jgi:RND family efflux transporter MFP subunit
MREQAWPERTPSTFAILLAIAAGLALSACDEKSPPPPHVRVLVQTVKPGDFSNEAELTGDIQARVQAQQSFRVGGKIIERLVEVGDKVKADQVLARLDPQEQQSNVDNARAALQAQEAQLRLAEVSFKRQQLLLPKGYTSKSEFDQAQAQLRSSQSSHAAAQAQLANARDMLTYTELKASADGVITERQAETGQVVQATVPIFTLARAGERDAVFDVYESLFDQALAEQPVTVALLDRPAVTAQGKVREITPTIDAQSGTVKVKVELQNAPEEMTLGAVVTATVHPKTSHRVVLPWSALFKSQQQPAVWLVDDQHKVTLQPISDVTYGSGTVLVGQGLQAGQQVVVAGGQLLHPGQQVDIATPEKAAEPEKAKISAPPAQEAKP